MSEVMLVVGASGVVHPAAGLARRAGAKVVIVAAQVALRGKAAKFLPG